MNRITKTHILFIWHYLAPCEGFEGEHPHTLMICGLDTSSRFRGQRMTTDIQDDNALNIL